MREIKLYLNIPEVEFINHPTVFQQKIFLLSLLKNMNFHHRFLFLVLLYNRVINFTGYLCESYVSMCQLEKFASDSVKISEN